MRKQTNPGYGTFTRMSKILLESQDNEDKKVGVILN